ncbi:MAG TPA: DUF1015 domain-containing protein, partial [Candidatus Dormibacteraeota bacterium]|nr:DUF1015 domain-containing protein [Candidatus Dormibacteraeota bacterium]
PHNAVRIVLNRTPGHGRYVEAAKELKAWLAAGVLRRDGERCFYVHRETFDVPSTGSPIRASRIGLLAAVRLEPWSAGAVKPHEHTMPGPKQDRLSLMRATQADTEPIWVFHPDPNRDLLAALEAIAAEPPNLAATFRPVPNLEGDEHVESHELWRVSHPATVARLATAASSAQLYIADGHHRYETALHHAGEVGGGPNDATGFKLMLLSAVEDPGLLVLPTHRLVKLPEGRSLGEFLGALQSWGWTSEQPAGFGDLVARLRRPSPPRMLGFGLVAERRYTYLEGPIPVAGVAALAPSIAALDVGLLHQGVLEPLLGIGAEQLNAGELISYSRDALEVKERVALGEYDLGILTRAPSLAQVQAVADAGQNMPQKSTYFWPKPASGLVMLLQPPGEVL